MTYFKLKPIKIKMARMGYYLCQEYAHMKALSRQAVFKQIKEKRVESITQYDRQWVKYDNGELGEFNHGPVNLPLVPFVNFWLQTTVKIIGNI